MSDQLRGHSTAGLHGRRPAAWADALRDRQAGPGQHPVGAVKHCWYDGPQGRTPALLLEWRNIDGYFHGRIVAPSLEEDGWAIVEMVVEQGLLSPAAAESSG